MSLTPEQRALLAPYVTNLDRPVFVLRNLPEEVVAVLFAYYSRSREPLRANLLKLLEDQDLLLAGGAREGADPGELALAQRKAREFHEKWVVGYGHASVAEHAVAHVAVEEVSIIASKAIEDCRLAAYTEKSTRYVPFPRSYHPLPDLPDELRRGYVEAVEQLFDRYEELLPRVAAAVEATVDRSRFKSEAGFRNSCRAQACDALRYLLPAGCHTNLGITANARTLEHMISKLLSSPLAEVREIGERIREETLPVIPTLIKYARRKDYWVETPARIRELVPPVPALGPEPAGAAVRIVARPADAERTLAVAILFEESSTSYEALRAEVSGWSEERVRQVIRAYLEGRRRYGTAEHGYTDPPLRCLEHLTYTFEVLVDYGAYRDIQRHRMATQTPQRLTCDLGYEVPALVSAVGCEAEFRSAVEQAGRAWRTLAATHPDEAQYVVPLAYRKRVLFTWNLRELHHFISLRSARQGHPSYRQVAQRAYRALHAVEPFLAEFIEVDEADYDLARPG